MNVSNGTTSQSAARARNRQSGAGQTESVQSESVAQESQSAVFTERNRQWGIGYLFCIILSIAFHIGLAYYLKDVVISFWVPQDPQAIAEQPEMPFEPLENIRTQPGYDDSALNSPDAQNSFERLDPTPAEKQMPVDEKTQQLDVDKTDFNVDSDFQKSDAPLLTEDVLSKPNDVKQDEIPSEEAPSNINRTYVTGYNPGDMITSASKPDRRNLTKIEKKVKPQSDWGALGTQTVKAHSADVDIKNSQSKYVHSVNPSTLIDENPAGSPPEINYGKLDEKDSSIPELAQSDPTEYSTPGPFTPVILKPKRRPVVGLASKEYQKRDPSLRLEMITQAGGDASISQTIENGLEFLSKTQWPDGRWRFHEQYNTANVPPKQNGKMRCDTAATGLALLSMLGAGYTHKDGKYKNEIQRGLNYLLSNQNSQSPLGANGKRGAPGALFNLETDSDVNSLAYAHAIATVALCEAYGLTQDPALLPAAQAAVRYVIATQNPERGGWRYEQDGQYGQPHQEADTSSSGWQVMALRSALAANVLSESEVAPALNRVQQWLDIARKENGLFVYNPYKGMDDKNKDWDKTTHAMTAEGLFMQLCVNSDLVAPEETKDVIAYLLESAPEQGRKLENIYASDVYCWYYTTTFMFAQKGDAWRDWQSKIMNHLSKTQIKAGQPMAGSWDSEKIFDKWSNEGGQHYLTTMNLMILEIYIRNLGLYK